MMKNNRRLPRVLGFWMGVTLVVLGPSHAQAQWGMGGGLGWGFGGFYQRRLRPTS